MLKFLSELIMSYGTGGMVLGGLASLILLSPKSSLECNLALQRQTDSFFNQAIPEYCLNILGFNASGFTPVALIFLGAALGYPIGWIVSRMQK